MDQRRPRGGERSRERRRSRTRSPAPPLREAAPLPNDGAAVACTRANLQPLFTSFKDMMKLVEVERFLLGERSTQQYPAAPSCRAQHTSACCGLCLPSFQSAVPSALCAPFPLCSPSPPCSAPPTAGPRR
jgi:hypothetical protein